MGEASSHIKKAGGGSFGGTELTFASNQRAIIARLLISVLTGLGGALQEDQQPALCKKALRPSRGAFLCLSVERLRAITLLIRIGHMIRGSFFLYFKNDPRTWYSLKSGDLIVAQDRE